MSDALLTEQDLREDVAAAKASTSAVRLIDAASHRSVIDHLTDIASYLTEDDVASYGSGNLRMLPMLAGAVVPVINIEGISRDSPPLILEGDVLVCIYLGTITKWDDARILSRNPELQQQLAGKSIRLVYRTDESGTTEIVMWALRNFAAEAAKLYTGSRTMPDLTSIAPQSKRVPNGST